MSGGWHDYIKTMVDACCKDAAIVGRIGTPSVWAAHPGGIMGCITPAEVQILTAKDRSASLINGVTIGGQKCSVIRDNGDTDQDHVIDLKTKSQSGEPTFNVSCGITCTAIVLCMGAEGVHGGKVNEKCHNMTKYLRSMGM